MSPKRPALLLLLLTTFTTALLPVALRGQAVDLDGDGFDSIASGGGDCVDSLQSVFKSNGACPVANPATVLDAPPFPVPPGMETKSDIADHSWVRDDQGVYHLFGHGWGYAGTVVPDYIRHYLADSQLTTLTPASKLALLPSKVNGAWDDAGLWAPHVFREGNLYYMFYTGVTDRANDPTHVERIGMAYSTDLTTWTKAPSRCLDQVGDGCVYECVAPWTTWDPGAVPVSHSHQCRDPFVIKVPGEQRWLLFTTVRLRQQTDSAGTVVLKEASGISVAETTNLKNGYWTSLGYIAASGTVPGGIGAQQTGYIAENPYVTEFDGTYFLFFTDWQDPETIVPPVQTMVQYATSPSLAVDAAGSANWTYRGSIPDPGVNATEMIVHEGDTWILSNAVVNANYAWANGLPPSSVPAWDLRLKRVVWGEDGTSFELENLTLPSCRVPSWAIHPGVPEVCNDGIDNNCNGYLTEGCGLGCNKPPCPQFASEP